MRTSHLVIGAAVLVFGTAVITQLIVAPAEDTPLIGESPPEAPDALAVRPVSEVPSSQSMHAELYTENDPGHGTEIECPAFPNVDAVLDAAGARYDTGDYLTALACANLAVDLIPQAVEAQHLRAAALSALGRFKDAQVAFAMALALDPDDPETLAAAADFYINLLPPKKRSTVLVGLEYARRGSERASTRRRLDRTLRARLFLLESEALNDIGRPDLALTRVEEALELAPTLLEAAHERGVSLFNLCRFEEAELAFLDVLKRAPRDPYAHHHLGLIYERTSGTEDAQGHFERARELSSAEFPKPVEMSTEEFRAIIDSTIAEEPVEVRAMLEGVSVEVVDLPALDDLMALSPPFAPTIMGLFRGLPHGVDPPPGLVEDVPERTILLYRANLARAVRSREELVQQIQRTLRHEIGHLAGLDEDELRRRGLD